MRKFSFNIAFNFLVVNFAQNANFREFSDYNHRNHKRTGHKTPFSLHLCAQLLFEQLNQNTTTRLLLFFSRHDIILLQLQKTTWEI